MTTQSMAHASAEAKFAQLHTKALDTALTTDDRSDAISARDAKIVRLRMPIRDMASVESSSVTLGNGAASTTRPLNSTTHR